MTASTINRWIDALGYSGAGASVYRRIGDAPADHPYGREIDLVLNGLPGCERAAVVDVERTPTVLFVDIGQQNTELSASQVSELRQHVWNQNLVSLVVAVRGESALALPASQKESTGELFKLGDVRTDGPLSYVDVASGNIQQRLPEWFDIESRVDRELLENLSLTLQRLEHSHLGRAEAQLLLGRILFVSYLEHRDIVGPYYRQQRKVGSLHELIRSVDRRGLDHLFASLKGDFNGDFLEVVGATRTDWSAIGDQSFALLDKFLSRVSIETGQSAFWNYDFRYIPVELLSGIYETFLSDEKKDKGAYYTPRHLANLAVDLAFIDKPSPDNEVVYDPACGSGILLTTAYRRMLRATERRSGQAMPIKERIDLLLAKIRGSDLSEAACRVTAFSLYLALMEDLAPADVARLRDDANVKLPKLLGKILIGNSDGDFFAQGNRLAAQAPEDVTVLLSNPPWGEPKINQSHLYEAWAEDEGYKLPHRNIAAAFAHKSVQSVTKSGRVCLILPVKLFASDTSRDFLRQWIPRLKVRRIVNFSDIRRLLFPSAIHPCVVVVGEMRDEPLRGWIPGTEMIEVWHAKSDVSLAFGRLSVHGIDRHRIPAGRLADAPETFRASTWGIQADRAVIGRLRLLGLMSDMTEGSSARWHLVKGFNETRHNSPKLDPGPLKQMQFLDTRLISRKLPVLDTSVLKSFPDDIQTVVSHGSRGGAAFDGARVLFPDGAASSFNAYAVFAKSRFCFRHTLAALCGPDEDEDLLRFISVYLRSPLAAYCLLHTAYALTTERTRVTLDEVAALPFAPPDRTNNRERSNEIIRRVADYTRKLEGVELGSEELWRQFEPEVNALVFEYFGITDRELPLIQDACLALIPSIQPGNYRNIRTPLCADPQDHEIEAYFKRLASELCLWREKLGGQGKLSVRGGVSKVSGMSGLGIATIELVDATDDSEVQINPAHALAAMQAIRKADLWPMQATRDLALSSDFLIYDGPRIHLVKPLVRRFWLERQAFDDARRIVESIGRSANA